MRSPVLVLLLVGLLAAPGARGASVFEQLNRELTDAVIVPGYQGFAAATASLEQAMSRNSIIQLFPDRRGATRGN